MPCWLNPANLRSTLSRLKVKDALWKSSPTESC
jgi:hypothetical protein